MSATSCTSLDDLTARLLHRADSYVHITRQASDDLVSVCLAKAAQIYEQGNSVRVVCADEISRQHYLKHLTRFPSVKASDITTMRELCLSIIANKQISQTIGRKARILDENEHDVLLEDLKVSGLKPGRLKEMLKFFYKGLSNFEDESQEWLITSEEQQIFALLEKNLEVRQAMISYELASKTYQGMVQAKIEREPLSIIADDYATLSKASQRLLEYLATSSLIVAGSKKAARNADESYPHLEGFTNFCELHPETYSLTLDIPRTDPERVLKVCTDPKEEFSFIAQNIVELLKQGMAPDDILIAVPNSTWKHNIVDCLQKKGIAISPDVEPDKIKGNPRFDDRCENLKLATFLKLYRNPSDNVALRSWLGFGDWLLRSDAFLELLAYAQDNKQDIIESITELRKLDKDKRPTQLFEKFDKPLDELAKLQKACVSPSQQEAIALFAEHGMPLDADMIKLLGKDIKHADLNKLAHQAFLPRAQDNVSDGVVVTRYRRCHGRHVEVLFFTGLINGFLPAFDAVDDRYSIDHKKKVLEREMQLFDDIEASAHQKIIQTLFEQDTLENTSFLNMQTSRVFIKESTRFARITPSQFLQAK